MYPVPICEQLCLTLEKQIGDYKLSLDFRPHVISCDESRTRNELLYSITFDFLCPLYIMEGPCPTLKLEVTGSNVKVTLTTDNVNTSSPSKTLETN